MSFSRLKHSLFTEGADDVCFFVKDPESLVQDYLEDHGNGAVTKVMGVDSLRKEYGTHEGRRELLGMYDLFLVDNRVAPMMPGLLGSAFLSAKKMPLPVDMRKDIVQSIARAVTSTAFSPRQGTSTSIRIGKADFSAEQLVENVISAVDGVAKRLKDGWDGIQSINIKTASSPSLPIYLALPTVAKEYVKPSASGKHVTDGKIKKRRRKKKSKKLQNIMVQGVIEDVVGTPGRKSRAIVEVAQSVKKNVTVKEASVVPKKGVIDIDAISLSGGSSEEESVKPVRRVRRERAGERASAVAKMIEVAEDSDSSEDVDDASYTIDEGSDDEEEEVVDIGKNTTNVTEDDGKGLPCMKENEPDDDCSFDSSLPRDLQPLATPTRRSKRVATKPKLFGEEQAEEELHSKVRKAASAKKSARKVKELKAMAGKENRGKPPLGRKTGEKKTETNTSNVMSNSESSRVTRRARPATAESTNASSGRTSSARKTRAGSVDSTGLEPGELRRSTRKRGGESGDSEANSGIGAGANSVGRSASKSKGARK